LLKLLFANFYEIQTEVPVTNCRVGAISSSSAGKEGHRRRSSESGSSD
jgi:hypothetical protein